MRRKLPSPPFVALMLALVGSVAFFVWGMKRPPLDETWRLQVALAVGSKTQLDVVEMRLMQETLRRHPGIADNLLDGRSAGLISANVDNLVESGWAYLVRTGPDPAVVEVALPLPRKKTVKVAARTLDQSFEGEASAASSFRFELPCEGPFPQLIEVHILARKKKAKKAKDKPSKKAKVRAAIVRFISAPAAERQKAPGE